MKRINKKIFITTALRYLALVPPAALAAAGAALAISFNSQFALPAALAAAASYAALRFLRPRKTTERHPFLSAAIALLAFAAVSFGYAFAYYFSLSKKDCLIDRRQLTTIYYSKDCARDAGDEKVRCETFSRDPYDLTLAGNKLAAVYSGLNSGILIAGAEGRKEPVFLKSPDKGPQRLLYDPERKQIVAGLWGSPLITVLSVDPVGIKAAVQVKKAKIIDVDSYGGKYYLVAEDRMMYIVDGRDYKTITVKLPTVDCLYSIRIAQKTGGIYISGWNIGFVYRLDPHSFTVKKRKFLGIGQFGMALDEKGGALLVAQPLRSRIAVLDTDTLALKRFIRAGFGVRDIQLDPAGKIHCANYFEGTYSRIDYRTGKTERKVHIGKLARGVFFDEKTGAAYAVSACGIFKIKSDHR
jgi:DNA-binding beta-propeller fold protein YncE